MRERRAGERRGRLAQYVAHVVPGLEELAGQEIMRLLPGARIVRVLRRFDERTSLLFVLYEGHASDLLALRLTEDVFVLAAESDTIPGGRHGVEEIRALVATSPGLHAAVTTALQMRVRGKRKVNFRVIARQAGSQAFRRVDMQRAVERAVEMLFPTWRLVEDDAQLEFWAHLVDRRFIAAIRLSDITMRQRTYRQKSIPAALKPTVARAMALLSEPQNDDVFLDPMCGSGTILIERAEAGRYRRLLGGDADAEAVAATRANIGPRYKPVEIRQWDARSLPLADASVSSLVTNLPFGKQIGTPAEIRTLYPALLKEWIRVLGQGGRMVLLTGDRVLLTRTLGKYPALVQEQKVPVLVRGYAATIFVVRRRGTA